jgi:hypothetical protein
MAIKLSVGIRNAMLDALEAAIGTSPVIKFRTGAPPTATTDADTGTVIATITCGADFMSAAALGVKAFTSVPLVDAAADAAGTIGHYRVYNSGNVCQMQGTVTATGGGGDMTFDNITLTLGQELDITGWTIDMNAFA